MCFHIKGGLGTSVWEGEFFKKVMGFKPDIKVLNLIDEMILKDAAKLFIFFNGFKHWQAAFSLATPLTYS